MRDRDKIINDDVYFKEGKRYEKKSSSTAHCLKSGRWTCQPAVSCEDTGGIGSQYEKRECAEYGT